MQVRFHCPVCGTPDVQVFMMDRQIEFPLSYWPTVFRGSVRVRFQMQCHCGVYSECDVTLLHDDEDDVTLTD